MIKPSRRAPNCAGSATTAQREKDVISQISPLADQTIEPSMLVNVARLATAYFTAIGERWPREVLSVTIYGFTAQA
jgi:hypothetical protein